MNTGDRVRLYRGEDYWVHYDKGKDLITLIMLAKRVMLRFSYEDWRKLRDIVAGIELPGVPQGLEWVELYTDGDHVFVESVAGEVVWFTMDRMISVVFNIEEWERFKTMMMNPGAPVPWDDSIPWIVI